MLIREITLAPSRYKVYSRGLFSRTKPNEGADTSLAVFLRRCFIVLLGVGVLWKRSSPLQIWKQKLYIMNNPIIGKEPRSQVWARVNITTLNIKQWHAQGSITDRLRKEENPFCKDILKLIKKNCVNGSTRVRVPRTSFGLKFYIGNAGVTCGCGSLQWPPKKKTNKFIVTNIYRNEIEKDLTSKIRSKLKYDENGRCLNAFQILSNSETLIDAYETIKHKSGNMVPGSDGETLDGISIQWFERTADNLTKESYQPKPSRRVYIPKANGKMRPLGISSPRDKIIQQSMRIVLENVLEPRFSEYSHGFRPSRGCHSALREIREWKGIPWVLEGDIKSFFDSIDHHLLAELLNKHFKEARLIHLYWKFAKAGYVEWDKKKWNFVSSDLGVPQGSIISPLLSNLVLHELDMFMDELIKEREIANRGKKSNKTNPKYHRLTMSIYRLRKNRKLSRSLICHKIRVLEKERRRLKSEIPNPDVIRIKYVRYADDWLVGIWGNKEYVKHLKNRILLFLRELKLDLSIEKTLITNMRSQRAKFLGVHIKRLANNLGPMLCKKYGSVVKQIPTGNLLMTAPMSILVERLRDKGYLEVKHGRWTPKPIPRLLILPIKDLILWYRVILNGFVNYYSFIDNKNDLKKIYWILKEGLRKSICQKCGIGPRTFLKRFGENTVLKIKRKDGKIVTLDYVCPNLDPTPMLFYGKAQFKDPLSVKDWKISTVSALGQPCANCGTEKEVEMHHVKHIKTINVKLSSFDKMIARINRKQVPLCKQCHHRVHNGTYHGMSLKFFHHIKWWGTPKWS